MFQRYCAMMRRNDLLKDPRFATPHLRRANLKQLLEEVRAWLATFDSLDQLQSQVSEGGLAIGKVRTLKEFSELDWVKEWNAVVPVDNREGGTVNMPGNPWIFSTATLPPAGVAAYQGEHNDEILSEWNCSPEKISDMKKRKVILSRKTPMGTYD